MTNPSPTVSMADKVALIDSLCAKARILPVITIAREQDVLPRADPPRRRHGDVHRPHPGEPPGHPCLPPLPR